MRTLNDELIRTVVQNFSHGAITHFDPARELGCQRESYHDLGFGWMYWSLARMLDARRILVIGSGRGFSVACLALGAERTPDARVTLVDPGYTVWSVEAIQDAAPGMWQSPRNATEHFERHLGLNNVQFLTLRSDEAFAQFQRAGERYDLIVVDGEHSYRQALTDLGNAIQCLNPGGAILAHDACCEAWPGVGLALDALTVQNPGLERISFPCFPGLAILKRRESFLEIRPISAEENEQVNVWREASGVRARPLPDGDDPRPGVDRPDSREGLFGVYERGELIGGYGLYRRLFSAEGADNFRPDAGHPLTGMLRFGSVLRPESQGKRRWQLVASEILRRLSPEGFYCITRYPLKCHDSPLAADRVGVCGEYTAYRYRFANSTLNTQQSLDELQQQRQRTAELEVALQRVSQELDNVTYSTSWRWTHPARVMGVFARGLAKRLSACLS